MHFLSLRRASAAAVVLFAATSAANAVLVGAVKVAMVGETLTGSDGRTVSSLNTPFTNGLGEVTFSGILNSPPAGTNGGFVFFKDQIVFRNFDVVSPVLSGIESTATSTDDGTWIHSPQIDGQDGVYGPSGTLVRGTDAAPGRPGEFIRNASRMRASSDTRFWVSGISATPTGASSNNVLYRATSDAVPSISPVLAGGDSVGAETIASSGVSFTYDVSLNNNHFINQVTLSAPTASDSAVVVDLGTIIAREGSPVSGGLAGENWTSFRGVGINNSGNWVLAGDTTAATTEDEVVLYNGAVIMRQGTVVDGLTLGGQTDAISINNNNEVAVIWDTITPTSEALFFGDATNPSSFFKLIQVGDTLDFDGDTIADYTLTDFSASSIINAGLDIATDGMVYFQGNVTPIGGGSAVSAIIGVAVPEPTSALALLGVGALSMIRRRRA